jgi:peptide/nickel transport system permease protein
VSIQRSLLKRVLGRLLWTIFAVYVAATAVFGLVVLSPDEDRIALRFAANVQGREAKLSEPPPLTEQYVDWLQSFVTLEWGTSTVGGQLTGAEGAVSNLTAVREALSVTLAYAVPATLVAFVLALLVGYRSARRPRALSSRLFAGSFYLIFGLPNFFVAGVMFFTLQDAEPDWFPEAYETGAGLSPSNLLWLVLPAVVLSTHLLAGYFRYTRSESHDSLRDQFVKFVRAKGAGRWRVARHVFRSDALSLVTLFITELLGVLLVTIFVVEVVFEVPGIGLLAYEGILERELELVMVLTMVFSLIAILASVAQDIAATTLDARIDSE